MKVENRYVDGTYISENPYWDREDSGWKASLILDILNSYQIAPTTICEIGCGAGTSL